MRLPEGLLLTSITPTFLLAHQISPLTIYPYEEGGWEQKGLWEREKTKTKSFSENRLYSGVEGGGRERDRNMCMLAFRGRGRGDSVPGKQGRVWKGGLER